MLSTEDVAAAALEVAAAPLPKERMARLLARLHAWAGPSLVYCVARDPLAESGWRVVAELASGQPPPGFERFLARLVEDAPAGAGGRPMVVRPGGDEVPGLKVRDTWVVPWRHGVASGYLLLRGVPRPYPANLGDAVALAAQSLWPEIAARLAGHTHELPAAERLGRLESALAQVRQLVERLEGELREEHERPRAASPAAASAAGAGSEHGRVEAGALLQRVEVLQAQVAALERRCGEAETQREFARGEAAGLKARLEELQAARQSPASAPAPPSSGEGEARTAALREALEQARAEREAARAEAEALRAERDTAGGEAVEQARRGVERAQAEASSLHDMLRAAEVGRDAERERIGAEQDALRKELESARAELAAARPEQAPARAAEDERRAFEQAQRALDEARGQALALQEQVRGLEAARAAAEAERDRGRAQANQLWASLESLQRDLQAEREQREAERLALEQTRARADRDREEAVEGSQGALLRAQEAEEQARSLHERWDQAVQSFRDTLRALRRTPFVPPTLRISVGEAESVVDPEAAGRGAGPPRPKILFLDRDTPGLDPLLGELEAAGIDVLAAHYPEEAAFFLKTPDSRGLTTLVCDVMAFRPEQNLLELFKSWRQDLPSLAFLLSFRADNPSEAEKVQRIPVTLAAGYLTRPLQRDAVVDAVAGIARRQGIRLVEPPPRVQAERK